ncbi:YlzJ-like family protein [Bacillus sp. 1P06AnD]|uniref:YlzJ-like family protein n=1 Tax=Bacillus sp. 1P06AnD TaxID=3132208 RepID=UPI0039A09475
MTLYTILPTEWVLATKQDIAHQPANVYYKGIMVTVEKASDFKYKVIQIHSTDPNDYLHMDIQPGAEIDMRYMELIQ